MAHKNRAEAIELETSSDDDDDLDIISATKKTLGTDRQTKSNFVICHSDYMGANCVTAVIDVSSASDSATEEDFIETTIHNRHRKGKRKAGERVEWSADEDDDPYQKFKNRAATKRKKTATTKKKLKERAKGAVARKEQGGPSATKSEGWTDNSDYELMEEEFPEYLKLRRRKFEKSKDKLQQAGLKLPPEYHNIYFSDDGQLEQLEERPKFPDSIKPSRKYKDITLPRSLGVIPASIAQYLRDYQIDGVAFLHELFVYQKGGILGDDMGLGKTVQVAAFLTAAFGKTGDERDAKRMRKMRRSKDIDWYPRALVVCPGTLIENWKQELHRWGWWAVDIFHGSGKEGVLDSAKSGRLEVVVTTYQTYKIHKSEINLIEWDCVVADECHTMKERSSEITRAMNEVNALCRIGLSGTVIQNKYEELWTLLNWTNPGRTFSCYYLVDV